MRRSPLRAALAAALLASAAGASAQEAEYTVTVHSMAPARFHVRATVPLVDDTLRAASSWACDLKSLCDAGWPLLLSGLGVSGPDGGRLAAQAIGARGWVVRGGSGRSVTLQYDVALDSLQAHRWPAPRESAYSDGTALYVVGRALFLGSSGVPRVRVRFHLPPGYRVTAGWTRAAGDATAFTVGGFDALVDNGVVIGPQLPASLTVGRFVLDVGLFGRWQRQRDTVSRLLSAHLATFTRLFAFEEPGRYLAVFLEDPDLGGEAFRDSYALSASPDSALTTWGRLIGHELFHYWNGQRIRGEDYAGSQWFQEGVTEYYAIVSMARNGFGTPAQALAALSAHLRAGQGLAQSLEASGTRKSRAFYGRATMVAFALDLLIRDATGNRRSLDELMRELWRAHGRENRPYALSQLYGLASSIAGRDLGPFFRSHVSGDAPLPMDSLLALGGLRVAADAGEESIAPDPAAPAVRSQVWEAIVRPR